MFAHKIFSDIRIYQIPLMMTLLLIGVLVQDFSIRIEQVLLTYLFGITTQYLFLQYLNIKEVGYLSVIITCTGLSLLVRSNTLWVHPLLAIIVNSSKFIIRIDGKHIFNPAMLGVILGLNIFPSTWISPNQWGYEFHIITWIIFFGMVVSGKSGNLIISISFLIFYVGILTSRIVYFGYRWEVLYHQITNGSLLLFTFFMITDPKTIPNHPLGKILYALIVSIIAYYWQFKLYKNNALIYGLFIATPIVPIIDKILKYKKFEWGEASKPTGGRS